VPTSRTSVSRWPTSPATRAVGIVHRRSPEPVTHLRRISRARFARSMPRQVSRCCPPAWPAWKLGLVTYPRLATHFLWSTRYRADGGRPSADRPWASESRGYPVPKPAKNKTMSCWTALALGAERSIRSLCRAQGENNESHIYAPFRGGGCRGMRRRLSSQFNRLGGPGGGRSPR
jgi:hypothetical protein